MTPFYDKAVFDLPDGPKNLESLFPSVDFTTIDEYFVELLTTADAVLLTTSVIKLCNCHDAIRVHFESRLGRIDAVNFEQVKKAHGNKSSEYKKPLPDNNVKTDTGAERFNVRSNETWEAITWRYLEADMKWLMECADSSKALLEWVGTDGQNDSFLPIVIQDGSWELKKIDNEFVYEFRIQFKMANEKSNLRN